MEWDEFNKLLHSKCPQRQAFVNKFIDVLAAWDTMQKIEEQTKDIADSEAINVVALTTFLETMKCFFNNWCPGLKDEYL